MRRITLAGIIPSFCVETEEQLQILLYNQPRVSYEQISIAHPHGVRLGTIHVPKKEISKFDRIQARKE